MKLESEPVICHSTITNKTDSKHYPFTPDSKSFESKENVLDSPGLKEREGIFKENPKGVEPVDFDFEDNEANEDPELKVGNDIDGSEKLGGPMRMEDITNDNEKEVSRFMKLSSLSSNDESDQKDSVFCVVKGVMECDLPELVVCYKESAYHVVKDICIDEGVPFQDKFLFDNGADETNIWDLMPPERDRESKALEEKQDIKSDMHEASVPSGETELGKGNSNQIDSGDLMHTLEWKNTDVKDVGAENDYVIEKIPGEKDEASKELTTLGQLLLMPESSVENSNSSSFDNERSGIYQQSLQNGSMEVISASPALISADQESDNDIEEAILVSSQASATAESTDNGLVNEVVHDKNVQSENIAMDDDSSALMSNSREEHKETPGHEPLKNGHTYRIKETSVLPISNGIQGNHSGSNSSATDLLCGPVTENTLVPEDNGQPCSNELPHSSGESSFSARGPSSGSVIGNSSRIEDGNGQYVLDDLQRSQGETSFSAAGPVSGLVSYSGPIAYCGSNLSLRSDSSTTSVRSFAFPTLQSEWNSSPVRMAKADRSQLRKHRWRQTLLCCRF